MRERTAYVSQYEYYMIVCLLCVYVSMCMFVAIALACAIEENVWCGRRSCHIPHIPHTAHASVVQNSFM